MKFDVNLLDIVVVFINAIDRINPILKNHHRRVSVIAYYIGEAYGLKKNQLTSLVLAASLHDIGALTVKDSQELMVLDVINPEKHAEMGARMLKSFKPFDRIRQIVLNHHVNYENEKENSNETIPYEAFIIHLADRIEILTHNNTLALNQREYILKNIEPLSGSVFDPKLVEVFSKIAKKEFFWFEIDNLTINELVKKLDTDGFGLKKDYDTLDGLVATLSRVIDYKSKFTASHSIQVSHVAYRLACLMELDDETCWGIKIAGYLHDFGKIAIPSEILDKNGPLTHNEYNVIKTHPYYTYDMLSRITWLGDIVKWAAFHHERLNYSGYPRKPEPKELDVEVEIVIYADIFSALSEDRPYRRALNYKEIMSVIDKKFKSIVGEDVYDVLKENGEIIYKEIEEIDRKSKIDYEN
ncbi:HD-GYP domain-containing protein [Helicovermis profundi]|uniref:HDIG domain-containing protein n=1 Tax=Helicovermis profundi TaxID=3065157 RepID=A0AAU9ERX4_9FIRM|nr:HDIG domain-containing protein [Clostridia bacterium S502]